MERDDGGGLVVDFCCRRQFRQLRGARCLSLLLGLRRSLRLCISLCSGLGFRLHFSFRLCFR